jgi:hypothetical protein
MTAPLPPRLLYDTLAQVTLGSCVLPLLQEFLSGHLTCAI